MAKGSGKTTFIVFIMFMMCLSSIVAAGGLYVTSKEKVDASNLEIRSEATNIAVLPRPGNIVGRYNATSLKGTKWNDLSGKGNHITSEKIKGTLTKAEGFKGEYVKGTKDDGFTLPQKFENDHWSFFAVARYGSEENQERIFVSGDTTEKIKVGEYEYDINWLIGHYSGKTGVAHYGNPTKNSAGKPLGWVTPISNISNTYHPISVHGKRPWIRITAQHNYFATDGKSRSTGFSFDTDIQKKFNNPKSIGINVGQFMDTESSDWNVYEILVYDTYLDGVDREKVDNYLKEKYILANLKSGISLVGGRPKITDTVKLSVDSDQNAEPWYGGEPRFGTQEDCRRFAQELGYPQWGHYNEKHDVAARRNTCFFYGKDIVEIKPEDQKVDGNLEGKGIEDMTFGCTQPYRNPKMNCEDGSGTGSNTTGGVAATASGAYCKAKKKLSDRIGLDWVQKNVCSQHCTKDACMKPTETFFDQSGAGTSYKLTDYCTWDHTPDFEKFYNDELIKDVATNENAEIPNKDEDENYIDYLGKHLATCKDFKYVVEGANTNKTLKNPPDTSRSASSVHDDNAMGTGHGQGRLDSAQAWSAKNNQVGEWYQINNDKVAIISGIKIQKRAPNYASQYVGTFKVKAKGVAGTWEDVDNGAIYTGNTSGGGDKVDVFFETPVEARYIRIYPQTWGTHMSLRAGIYVGK